VSKPLWERFQSYKDTQAVTYKEQSTALTEEARTRRASTISEEHRHRVLIKREGIPTPKMRKELTSIRALRDLALKALSQEISDRRGELMKEYKQTQTAQYKNYLEAQALAGEEKAYLEFRRVTFTPDDKERLAAIEAARAAAHAQLLATIENGIADATLRAQQVAERVAIAETQRQDAAAKEAIAEAELKAALERTAVDAEMADAIALDSPVDLLDDIKRQASAYQQGNLKHSSKAIMLADTANNKVLSGPIVCSNDDFVTALHDNKILIHQKELFSNIEYDGKAEGHNRFAPGSTLEVQYRHDGKVKSKITENRHDFKSPDRHDGHEHSELS
jgi:hypothetical protein